MRQYFRNQHFTLVVDSSKTISFILNDLFVQVKDREKQIQKTKCLETVIKSLVSASLQMLVPEKRIEIHDEATGDFVINDTCIYCTIFPKESLIEKCKSNIKAGIHPIIVTIKDRSTSTGIIIEDADLTDRVEVWDIQQFISTNVLERSLFDESKRNTILKEIIDRYNNIIDEVENDPSLKIEFITR